MSALALHPVPIRSMPGRLAPSRRRSLRAVPALPTTDAPVIDTPVIDPPVVDVPVIDNPVIDNPVPDAPVAARASAAQAPLRLTTRGRRVLIALGFVISIALGAGLGAAFYSPTPAANPASVDVVVVQQGQSLWSIASGVAAPGQDVREVVAQIQSLNGLQTSAIHSGQELTVPGE